MPQAPAALSSAKNVSTTERGSASGSGSASDFETAIEACGFGCFNIILMTVSTSALVSAIFSTSSLSFIIPTAECDLKLSLMQKGALNAMCFAGMIISAIPWGFIADTIGRKKVLVYGLILDGIMVFATGISQNVNQLLTFKFFDGFLVCGPFAVVMSYVSEFHGIRHRSRIIMLTGMINSAATIVLPVMACSLLPYHLVIEVKSIRVHTWQIFILITSVVPFFGGISHIFIPESPKFLMSQGRNNEALECLRYIYAVNHRKSTQEFPITKLIDEDPIKTERYALRKSDAYKEAHKRLSDKRHLAKQRFLEGILQLKPMCKKPYFNQFMLVCCMLFCILLGFNSIRLWLPQIFATMVEFENEDIDEISMCKVLLYNYNKTKFLSTGQNYKNCDVHINSNSYADNIIVAIVSFLSSLVVTLIVNKIGNNTVLKITLILSFFSGISMYFSNTHLITLILASIFGSSTGIASTTVISVSVNLFPTDIRTMVIIMVMTFGRCGSLLGSLLFPIFTSLGCTPPFLLIGAVMIVSFILSLFLPNTNKIALK